MKTESEIVQYMENIDIPVYMRTGILDYVMNGVDTGHFLRALFSNDLAETYARADGENTLKIKDYITLMYNALPAGCWGSESNYNEWIKRKGLEGIKPSLSE